MAREPLPLLPFALGTLHAALLMAALVLLAHARGALGGLLSTLGTLPGLALFAWLWLLSCGGAWKALESLDLAAPPRRLAREAVGNGMVWGAGVGAAFLGGLLLALLAANLRSLGGPELLGAGLFLAFGLAGASVVGSGLGGLFAALDLGLLALARRLAPP